MPPVVVLDACVRYPAAQRDLFMWLAAGGAIHAHWTNEIHDEWMRNVEHDYGVDRGVLDRARKLMDRAAGDALIGRYRRHERWFPKTSTKDRHAAAAAVAVRKHSGKRCCGIHANAREPPKPTQDDPGVRRYIRSARPEEVRGVDNGNA